MFPWVLTKKNITNLRKREITCLMKTLWIYGRVDDRGTDGWERWIWVPDFQIINKWFFFSSLVNSFSEASPSSITSFSSSWISDSKTFSLWGLLIFFFFAFHLILIPQLLYVIRPGLWLSHSSMKHPQFLSSFSLLCLLSWASICSGRWRTSLSVSFAGEKIHFHFFSVSLYCPGKPLLLPLLLSQLESKLWNVQTSKRASLWPLRDATKTSFRGFR